MNKNMVKDKTLFWLNKGIEEETKCLKKFLEKNNNESQVEDICTTIGLLSALKKQAQELIEKL